MNNIEELKSAYRDVELTARNMRGKPEEYRVVTGFCPVNVVEMQAQKIQALIAQLEASQKELFDFHNQEFQQRLANAEHQLYMKDLAIHNIKASRKAQFRKRLAAEAELSAANEKLKGEQVPVEYQYRYHNHGTGCGEWCRVLTKERYEELQREHAGDNDFVFRMLFTAPQKPVALLDKYVRNEKGQYILDGKCEPRIGFAVGWNAAIRAAGGKVEGNADEK
ncbi:hypothetical protein [Yersinia enterocolitica]|uniref:hypothetical protein n=1 Tax=Yersinia enterocolitica TaxID=630 RepID=UPI002AC395E2|nr:hypothetical protein [Yersinia enterocolitica]EKN6093824.1 hypothetical protein [Yersinia enterocolitica]HEN3368652.1 hypothetical protein [Yersinia enterocolitica]HEN3473466.1 hypothetical protein [Yersinia enterocolitica]